MAIRVIVEAGVDNQFKFTTQKNKCTNNDIALAIATLKLAETALMAELARSMNIDIRGNKNG